MEIRLLAVYVILLAPKGQVPKGQANIGVFDQRQSFLPSGDS